MRNPYRNNVDFAALALRSPDFASCLTSSGQPDFSDPNSIRQLTKTLLRLDFSLAVDPPRDRLCPPVPNRLNYVLWLQDLLDSTSADYRDDYDPDRDVAGLDIGTGCCCIYPLLGCASRPRWEFVATDIDEENVQHSQKTAAENKLESRIKVLKTDPADELIPLHSLDTKTLDFTMCNPPFYASRDEMLSSAEAKEKPPSSACTGAETEMVTAGGEVTFVSRMLEESLRLRDQVTWYTTMLGKLSSVSMIVEKLMLEHGNHNYAVTEFVQGAKTKRWAVAWSWTDLRPAMHVARGITGFPKHLLPFPSEYTFDIADSSLDELSDRLDTEISALAVQWNWRKNLCAGVGFAMENVWSRQARRKMKTGAAQAEIDEHKAALGFKVRLTQGGIDPRVHVVIRWLKGTDSVLYESFCGMLKRKLEGR
ncbi:DUF890 domain-containing protein [Aspergillus sp. HF37]|nr:DUF890 domain-containing protein [Aspergillus sp. HF37]